MKKQTIFLHKALICLLLVACQAMSQTQDYAPRDYSIVPPAPQVAALMDYKDYPVDYFRGLPQISFLLYVLKVGQIEVPVTLSYHGGGVRVEQKTGNAGLGWNVSCGATISHTVYGAPDAANDNIHGLWYLNNDEKEFRERLISKEADYDPTNADEFRLKRSWQATLGRRYYEGLTDVANDLYGLSGQGLSATFALFSDNETVISSENSLTITVNNKVDPISDGGCDGWGFAVSTNEGLTYQFSTQDRTKYKYNYGSPELDQHLDSVYYSSAWHLNSIKDLSGNTVDFTYNRQGTRVWEDTAHPVAFGYSNDRMNEMSVHSVSGVNTVEYYTRELTSVTGNGITISFEYVQEATSDSDARIEIIKIKTESGDERQINFVYTDNLLTLVKDEGEIIYRFTYNAYNANNEEAPSFERRAQDFGGYCNGKHDLPNLIPEIVKSCGPVGWGADRSVNPEYATEASLKRIEYATGGYTEFEWESNTFSHLGSVPFYGEINNAQVLNIETDTIRACMEDGYARLNIYNWNIQEGQQAELDLTHYFDMNPANLFGSAYHDTHVYDVYPEINPPHHPHVIIRNHATGAIEQVYFLDKATIEPANVEKITTLSLSPGTYDFELKFPTEVQGAEDFMEAELLYHDCVAGYIYLRRLTTDNLQPRGSENWCGLRIKRIISSAGTDENDILRKDYYYNRAGDPNETSGTVQILPMYDYMHYKNIPHQGLVGYESGEVYCVGEAAFPQTTNGPLSLIEYPIVSVCMGREDRMEPDSYLRSYFETNCYSSARDQFSVDYNFSDFRSFQPIGAQMYTSRSHRRGNLEKKISNKYTTPGITTEYAYNIYEDENVPVLTTDAFTVCDFRIAQGESTYGTYDYGIGTYTLIPYSKTISYEGVSQADGFDSYKKYEYFYNEFTDALDRNLLKTVTASDSEHGQTTTHYTYVRGEQSYLPYPETEITLRGDKVLTATRTEYDPATRLPLRKYTLSNRSESQNLLSENQNTTAVQKQSINKLTYEYRYNSRGNVIQISYKGAPLASYIWGYNGQYPIIEATDVDYETLVNAATQSGLTNQQIDGRTVATDQKVSAVSQQLRAKLPSSNITAISYHWLLGVAKTTTPRGDSTSYSYDNRGRLIEIRDFNNYLINKYEYHYENATSH